MRCCGRGRSRRGRGAEDYETVPPASVTHFFVKLFLAAPASFFSAACASQESVSHFFRKEFFAAPASFFSPAETAQVEFWA